MKAAYNAFDIVTLASSFGEGFLNVVGEAMACGIPAAATAVNDVRVSAVSNLTASLRHRHKFKEMARTAEHAC